MPLLAQNPKNRVILGLMTFGPDESAGARITSLSEYNKCLDYFQSQGYNEVDTARTYIGGQQEAFTREARWKERGLKLATKCYPTEPGMHRRDQLKGFCNKSLSELGTECVDIFYLHAPDRSVPFEESLEACNELHKEGKFVELGLSNYAAWEVAEIVITCRKNGWVQPTVYQAMYNVITRSIETELIPCCRKFSLSIVIYNPLAGGIFSGRYKNISHTSLPSQGRYSNTATAMGSMYRDRYFKPEVFECLALIEPVAKNHDLTLLEIALRWCVHHSQLKIKDGGDGVLIGVSSLAQLEGNLSDLEKGPLPEEVVQALDRAWLVSKATTPTYWR
ncbi:hypothetical protein GJ744_003510 [Endocarpon pusillum]|uniref:NADP-dependent oxidoreductase domain-containing protein n=1 Tax=Endocarpon pusillum TaxID=364733 RepID=A0A8H7E613_9EURO|nr:hypothetical protein GJ744_003510 [Endocarpon pusillum]